MPGSESDATVSGTRTALERSVPAYVLVVLVLVLTLGTGLWLGPWGGTMFFGLSALIVLFVIWDGRRENKRKSSLRVDPAQGVWKRPLPAGAIAGMTVVAVFGLDAPSWGKVGVLVLVALGLLAQTVEMVNERARISKRKRISALNRAWTQGEDVAWDRLEQRWDSGGRTMDELGESDRMEVKSTFLYEATKQMKDSGLQLTAKEAKRLDEMAALAAAGWVADASDRRSSERAASQQGSANSRDTAAQTTHNLEKGTKEEESRSGWAKDGSGNEVNRDDPIKEAVKQRFAESLRTGQAFQYLRPSQTEEWWQLRTVEEQLWLRFNTTSRVWEPQMEPASGEVQKSGACWFEVGPGKWGRLNPATGTAESCDPPPSDPVLDQVRTIMNKVALQVTNEQVGRYGSVDAIPESEVAVTAAAILGRVADEFGLAEREAARLIVQSQSGAEWDEGSPLSIIAAKAGPV